MFFKKETEKNKHLKLNENLIVNLAFSIVEQIRTTACQLKCNKKNE